MQKFWKILILFWRPLMLWNLLFSLAGFCGITLYGLSFFGVGMIFKLLGYASSIYFQHHFSSEKKYFYLNAGQSMQKMYSYTFLVDFFVYMLLLIFYLKLR